MSMPRYMGFVSLNGLIEGPWEGDSLEEVALKLEKQVGRVASNNSAAIFDFQHKSGSRTQKVAQLNGPSMNGDQPNLRSWRIEEYYCPTCACPVATCACIPAGDEQGG